MKNVYSIVKAQLKSLLLTRFSILIFLISVSQYILLCAQQNVRHPRNIKAE